MNYGLEVVEHLVTSPIDKNGIVTQIFVLSLPLNILRQQYRTSQNAQRAIFASTDLATNPRVLVQILPKLRTVTAIAIPGTMPARYRSDFVGGAYL